MEQGFAVDGRHHCGVKRPLWRPTRALPFIPLGACRSQLILLFFFASVSDCTCVAKSWPGVCNRLATVEPVAIRQGWRLAGRTIRWQACAAIASRFSWGYSCQHHGRRMASQGSETCRRTASFHGGPTIDSVVAILGLGQGGFSHARFLARCAFTSPLGRGSMFRI